VLFRSQQEYECAWVDESVAWIDWELIKRNQALDQEGNHYYETSHTLEGAFDLIEKIAQAVQEGKAEPVMVAGYDVGRLHDLSECVGLGVSTSGNIPYRFGISLDRIEFDDQAAVIDRMMERLPIAYFLIDQNGLGMQLAENSQRKWGARVSPAEFTNPNKVLWAVETKLRFQRTEIPVPTDRDLCYQIHSLKKRVTDAKNIVFDVEKTEHHHADKFWALALAVWATKENVTAMDWITGLKARKTAAAAAPDAEPEGPKVNRQELIRRAQGRRR
jgi:phage FluMu gp28-like protein